MKLSIIVPVYNVENYIEECINSLLNQSLNEIEIIIINDGTKDKSIDKIKKIEDSRIKIINQENKGLSAARNVGIKLAQGEYITFVDSDDFIAFDNAYQEMYDIAKNEKSDIVSGNALWYYSKNNNHPMHTDMHIFTNSPITSEEYFIKCMKSKRVYAPVWINIYKKSLLVDNELMFKEGVFHEDEDFTPRVLLNAKNISIYNKEFYVYRQRENSIMNSGLNFKKGNDILNICLDLEKSLSKIKNDELNYLFKKYIFDLCINQIEMYQFKYLPKDIKDFVKRNAMTNEDKIKSILISINIKLYTIFIKIYRYKKKRGKITYE